MAEQRRPSSALRFSSRALSISIQTLLPALVALFMWPTESFATHAMGGELTYECVGPNLYRVKLNFYRDCNGVDAPTNCNNGRSFTMRSTQCGANITPCFGLDNIQTVTPICGAAVDRCDSPSGAYGIERYRYSALVDLSAYAGCGTDWVIEWSLCCRNNAITSLNNPGSRDIYLSATLNNTLNPCNNSPRFLNDPTPFACVGQPVSYSHGFNDLDGDSLSFELAPALGNNGTAIPYNPGYSFLQPIVTSGGANAVQIDPVTGTITFTPSIQQFAVVSVRVKEWRNGVQIGTYVRDVQFAIIACSNSNPTATGINGTNQYVASVCAGQQLCFTVNSNDVDAGQVVTMSWNNGIPGATFNISGSPYPTGTFCWTPTAANIGQNLFAVNVQDDACVLNGVNNYGYVIQVTPALTTVNAGPDQQRCGTTATLAATLPAPSLTGTWSVVTGSAVFANPNSPTTTVSGLSFGTNTLRWTVNFGTCGTAFDDVVITAFNPSQPAANAGPGQQLCTPNNQTTLAANTAVFPAVGTWTVVSGAGVFANPNSPTTQVTGLVIGQNIFRWTINNGPCGTPTSNTVTVQLYDYALPAATAGPDQLFCSVPASVQMNAQPANGTWSVVAGTGVFADPTNRNTTVTGLSLGVNTYQWTIFNGPCVPPTTNDQISVIVYDPSAAVANAGPNQQVCASSTTLAGNAPTAPATGQWILISGAGTITDPSSPTSTVTGLGFGSNVFRWTINNGPCGTTNSQVTITRFDPGAPSANAGPDQNICTPVGFSVATATLAGNGAVSPSTGLWTLISGTGTITTPTSPTTTVTGMPVGTHVLQWTITNGPCIPNFTSDQVTINIFDRTAPAANAGPDQEFCAPVTNVTLAANVPVSPATGSWSVVSGTGTFANPNSPTTTVSGMSIGSNVYRWTTSNGNCPSAITSDDVIIRLFDPAAPTAAAGPDQQICGSSSVTLAGSSVSFPAVGTWTLISGTGVIVSPNSPTSVINGIGVGESVFQWTVNNGPCGTTSDQVSIFRFSNTNPVAAAGPDQSICVPVAPNVVTMAGSAVTFPAVGTWSIVSGGGTIVSPNSPTTQITDMPVGINEFQWTVNNGACIPSITTDNVRVLVYSSGTPIANAGPDQDLCSVSGSTTMAGSSLIIPATGQWVLVSGSGTIADPSSPTTSVSGLGVGQNIFQWTVNNGPCANGLTTDQMSIFVYDPNNPSANAGPSQSLCTSAGNTITLNGSNVIFPAVGVWSVSGGPATIVDPNSPTTLVTDLGPGTYSFTWTVDNGVCPNPITSSTSITIVADGTAQPAAAGPDQSQCGTAGSVVMAANTPTGVATGSWSVVQGTATFSDPTSPTATVSGLSIGVNILQWNIDNVDCGITTDQVSIFVYDPNNPVAAAGADQQLCTPTTSTTLTGSAITIPAVGQWTLISGSGTIANPNSPSTAVSGLGLGENVFQWQVNNGVCANPITSDQVSIFVYDQTASAADAGPDQDICTPTTSVTMAGNAPVASAIGTWSIISGGGTIVSPNSPTTSITNLPVGINVFEWSINNGSCGTTTSQVTINVFDQNNPDANAGPDQELCTPTTSTTLAGSSLTIPATGQWTLVSGSGTIADPSSPTSSVSGLAVGENIFQWSVSNGNCANANTTDQVSIFVFDELNADADAGPDQEFCTPVSSATLTGNAPIFPATGTWTIISGSGVITDPSSPTTTITGLTVGVTVCGWTVSNGPCANGITTDEVSIFIFDGNNADADAGPDQELCTPTTSTTLAGNSPIFPASGQWTLISGGGVIADPSDPTSTVSGLLIGENIFEWTVSNGPCANGVTSDQVSIFLFDSSNPVADAGPDLEQCTPNTSITLFGSPVTFPATGQWTLVSGVGTISDPTSPTTTVTDLGVGQNTFEWTVSNGPCTNGITSDQIDVFIFDLNNPTPNAGPDQELCTPNVSTNLAGSVNIFPATGTWSLLSGQGTIVSPMDPNSQVTNLGIGENIFAWTISNGPCENSGGFDVVSIFVYDENNPDADAGPDQELCTDAMTSTTLQGSAVTFPATGQWTLVSGTGIIVNPSDPNTAVIDLEIGVSVFEWTVSNGPCGNASTSDQVSISIFDQNNPDAAAGPDQDLCTPNTSAVMAGSAVVFPAVGTWTILSGTGTIVDPNDPNTTINGLGVGVITVEWSVYNGSCTNSLTSDTLIITLYDGTNPLADAGPDQELCTPDGTTTGTNLQGSNVIFPAVGTWQLVNGTGTIADVNDPNSAVSDLGIGENIFLWTVTNGVCNDPITTDLVSILVFSEDNPDADAGPDQQVCTPLTNAFLEGSPVTFPAAGTWTVISGTGTFQDATDPLTEVTGLTIGTNIFEWSVYNGSCANSNTSDQVTIVLFDADAPPADAGPDQELCSPDDMATLSGNAPVGAAVGTWVLEQGTGVIADPNNPVTDVSGLSIGENIFSWTIVSGVCVTTTDQVSVFVFDPANPDAMAGLDVELCTPEDSVFMAGSAVTFPAQGTWTLISGAGTPVDANDPGTLIEALGVGVNVFEWSVYNGPCANSLTSDLVSVTLFADTTAAANGGPDLESCIPIWEVQMQGETPPAPAQGTWTLIAGAGLIAEPNNPTTMITALEQGVNTFVWTLEWDPCPNNGILTDTVNVLVYDPAAPVADAGPDQQLCTPDTTTFLEGNIPEDPGVGTWTVLSGGAVVVDMNDPTSEVTGLTVGVHEFLWTIYNGDCGFGPPSADTVRVSVYDSTAPDAQAGNDISWCTPTNSAVLQANDPIFPAVGTWTSLTGTGTIADPNDPFTAVFDLGVGQHDFLWTIDNGACGSSSDTISVFIFDGDSEAASTAPDKELCTPEVDTTIEANVPVFPATGTWTLVTGTGTIADPSAPSTAVTGLSIGTNQFVWTIDNEPCFTTSDTITVVVFDENHPPADAGADQQLCTPTSSTMLQGSAVTFPATGNWTIVSGTATISDPSDPTTMITGLTVGQVVMEWTVSNGPCDNGITTDQVVIDIFDNTAADAAAGPDQSFCTPIQGEITMFANAPVFPATAQWTLVSGTGTIADPADPFSVISGLGLGANTFTWTIDNGECGSSSDEVTIFVYDHTEPAADAGPSQQFCQDVSSTELEAVPTVSTGVGSWALWSGSGTVTEPFDPYSMVSGLALGNNYFIWSVDNGACGNSADTMLVFIKDCLTITIPNAFSPNGDGVNDVVVILNIESYPENRLLVYNRWGNKVLDRSPYNNDWDGTNQFSSMFGEKLTESTYYYVLDLGDGSDAYTGYIYLRR